MLQKLYFEKYVVPKLGVCQILRLGKPNFEFQVWAPILRQGKPNLESAMLPNLKIGQLHSLKIGLPKLGIINDYISFLFAKLNMKFNFIN